MNGKKIAILCAAILACTALVLGITFKSGAFKKAGAEVTSAKKAVSEVVTSKKTETTENTTEETTAETTAAPDTTTQNAETTTVATTAATTKAAEKKTTATTVKESTFTKTTKTTTAASTNSFLSIEQDMLNAVNGERIKAGLPTLTLNSGANACARIRAEELLKKLDHTRPDGSVFYTVLSQGGVGYSTAGENIAAGQVSVKEVMTSWMNSEGHRANILNAGFTQLGCACVYSPDNPYVYYWVQIFIG